MSAYKEKSERNLKAAEILSGSELRDPAIHCLYYACFQRVKHFLFKKLEMSEKALEEERKNLLKEKREKEKRKGKGEKEKREEWKTGSHEFLIWKAMGKIRDVDGEEAGTDFANKIRHLKRERNSADYGEKSIEGSHYGKALQLAQRTINIVEQSCTKIALRS